MNRQSALVYGMLLEESLPAQLPGPWSVLACHHAFVRLPSDLMSTMARLRGAWDEADLLEAGILVPEAAGKVGENPLLLQDEGYLFAPGPRAAPKLVVAGLKTLSAAAWSVKTLLTTGLMTRLFRISRTRVFVVFSAADLALFWSLGLAAIPCEGLASLGGDRLDMFCEVLRLSRPRTGQAPGEWHAPVSESSVSLILVNWSPATGELNDPPEAAAVALHFAQLARQLGIDLSAGGVWKPSAEQWDKIAFRLQYGARAEVVDAVLESVTECRTPFTAPPETRPVSADELWQARRLWERHCRADDDLRRAEAWDSLCRLQDQALLAPLREAAQAATDPQTRNLAAALAEVSRLFHLQVPVLATQLNSHFRRHGPRACAQLPSETFRQCVALADRTLALTRELRTCRTHKRSTNHQP